MNFNVASTLNFLGKLYGSRDAIEYRSDDGLKTVSFKQFVKDVKDKGNQMELTYGSLEGKHVALLGKLGYAYLVSFFSIMYKKGVAIPFNIFEAKDTLQYQLNLVEPDIVLLDDTLKKHGIELAVPPPKEKHSDPKDLRLMLFTSGTTGKNKAVMLSDNNLIKPVLGIPFSVIDAKLSSKGKLKYSKDLALPLYNMLPLYHIAGLHTFIIWLFMGKKQFMGFDMKYMKKDFKEAKFQAVGAIPSVLKMLQRDIEKEKYTDLTYFKQVMFGGAPLPEETLGFFIDKGAAVSQGYGMTETGGFPFLKISANKSNIKSVGKVNICFKAKIEDGEVLIKPKTGFLGYYNNQEETKKLLTADGYIKTGDLGYIDKKGYLYITGRRKNLIILSGGENVNPEELEAALGNSNLVEEVIVKAENDRIVADVFCRKGINKGEFEAYVELVNRELPIFKRISKVNFLDAPMEKTGTGKIKR